MFGLKKNKIALGYLLRLEDIQITEKTILCIFSEKGGITPLKVNIKEIFENENIFRSISPETTLVLRKLYQLYDKEKNMVKITGILNKNIYEIVYNEKFKTKISGYDLCQDYDLLSKMDIKDAFKVIYNTVFNHAVTSCLNSHSAPTADENLSFPHEIEQQHQKLRIVK